MSKPLPTKKKRVSKKLKVSWRKHVNIDDVEEFLEEQRLEERLGPPLSTLSNDQLFQLDTKPSTNIVTIKNRKQLLLNKPLKCFSALQPYTKVPDPISKRNRVRTQEERKSDIVKRREKRNKFMGILKQKEIGAIKERSLDAKRRKLREQRSEIKSDLWGNENIEGELNNEWIPKNTKKHTLRNTGKPQKDVLPSIKEKKSILPAVAIPHPGISYNPSFEDHHDLLKQIVNKESEIIRKEAHLNRVTRGMFGKVTATKRDANWLVEMSEGLVSQKSENDDDVDASKEYKPINPPAKNQKKTRQQRRKQKEQQELKLALKNKKIQKKKITDIHQLKVINKQIEKTVVKQNVLREKRKVREKKKETEAKRLAATKFEEPELEFNMAREITGNLRNLKKEGNLLADRFKSMQKRNILEPTIKRVRKRAKVKKYTKPGFKDEDWKKTVAKSLG